MRIFDLYESTVAGAIATVESPLGGVQKRNPGVKVKGLEPADKVMFGKSKKSGPYKNSLSESRVKQLLDDLKELSDAEFKKKYGKTKQEMSGKKKVEEAELAEDDIVIVPGQGRKFRTGFVPKGASRVDHEVEMARSDLFQAAKNAKTVYNLIKDISEEQGLDGWVQEKIIKANDYLNTVREYLEHKMYMNEMTGGVIAAGGVGENLEEIDRRGFLKGIAAVSTGLGSQKLSAQERPKIAREVGELDVGTKEYDPIKGSSKLFIYLYDSSELILRYIDNRGNNIGEPEIFKSRGQVPDFKNRPTTMYISDRNAIKLVPNGAPSGDLIYFTPRSWIDQKIGWRSIYYELKLPTNERIEKKLSEEFASQQQAKLMYATAGGADTGVSKKVAKEFIKKSHGQKVSKLPKKVEKK